MRRCTILAKWRRIFSLCGVAQSPWCITPALRRRTTPVTQCRISLTALSNFRPMQCRTSLWIPVKYGLVEYPCHAMSFLPCDKYYSCNAVLYNSYDPRYDVRCLHNAVLHYLYDANSCHAVCTPLEILPVKYVMFNILAVQCQISVETPVKFGDVKFPCHCRVVP
jgi:hypothetical protein